MQIEPSYKQLLARARQMRTQPTSSEALLWSHLRAKQLDGNKFRRQHILAPYIVDFYCFSARLVVEIDGKSHQSVQARLRDEVRTRMLIEVHRVENVVRFGNREVLTDLDSVLEQIREVV